MNQSIMIFTIFSALAGILIFAIWSNNNFYVYARQSYSPSITDAKKGIDNNQCGLEHSNSY